MTTNRIGRKDSPGIHVPPPLIYVAVFLLGLWLERLIPPRPLPTGPRRIAAVICVALWLVFAVSSVVLFRRGGTSLLPHQPARALVTRGAYRVSRNPMYVGLLFLYAGIALWFDLVWPIALLPVIVVVIQAAVIKREERYLERRFGDQYREYRQRVRRWF